VIRVPADIDEAALEQYRARVEADLNDATKRAYVLADGSVA
jgi:hypothetical protein